MPISIKIGAPSLTGSTANALVTAAFVSGDFPLTARIINNASRGLSFPEIAGLNLAPASDTLGRFKIVVINRLSELKRLASSIEQVAERNLIREMVIIEQVVSLADDSAFIAAQNRVIDANTALKRVATDARDGDIVINAVALAPLIVSETVTLNRVSGTVGVSQANKLIEIGIYDQTMTTLLVSTERREVPQAGGFEFAHPNVTLQPGKYFYAVSCTGDLASFGHSYKQGGFSASAALPLVSPLTGIVPASSFPTLRGYSQDIPKPFNFDVMPANAGITVYGSNGTQPWGLNTVSNNLCYSTDNGATYINMMAPPTLGAATIVDILFSATKMYVLLSDTKIFESSNLTNTATWTAITCPVSAGLKRAVATTKTYGVALFSDYLFWGEYADGVAGGDGDLQNDLADPGPPRILKYGPLSGTPAWTLSKQLTNARRVHSFFTNAAGTHLWASVGDATYGTDIGIWRLTYTATDNWTQWTSPVAPNTSYYPVDLVEINPGLGCSSGIYGSSSNSGKYLLFGKGSGKVGSVNIASQLPNKSALIPETAKSLVVNNSDKNMFFFSESADPFLHVSPAPYTQSRALASTSDMAFIGRSVVSGNYLINGGKRWKLPKFPWQQQ
ncbi:MAG: hypothetical protein WC856_02515 [Methylococcaceae bacterium]|jgi:hypothetical protein